MAARTLRILDFDIENRPLSYLGQDFTTAEITAIAAGFTDSERISCWTLKLGGDSTDMLTAFRRMYDRADMVTGHYIRRHDLPIINGALLEHGRTVSAETFVLYERGFAQVQRLVEVAGSVRGDARIGSPESWHESGVVA